MFYSKSTKGFYDSEIHGSSIPEDAVEISNDLYQQLLNGQSKGQEIGSDKAGNPILIDKSIDPKFLGSSILAKINSLLVSSDWTQLPDSPLTNKTEWATYRQVLRDLSKQKDFPLNVVFPSEPEKS